MTTIFRKFILGALIAALVIAALPLASVYAAGATDTATPPAPTIPDPTIAKARIELAFARQQVKVARIGVEVANFDLSARSRPSACGRTFFPPPWICVRTSKSSPAASRRWRAR